VVDSFQVHLYQGPEGKRIPVEPVVENQPANESAFLRSTKIVASIAMRIDTGQGTAQRRVRKESGPQTEAQSSTIGAWTAAAGIAGHEAGCWILDSGATHHMCSEKTLFQNLGPHSSSISIAKGGMMKAMGIGEVLLTVWNGKGETTQIQLHDVLYFPVSDLITWCQSGIFNKRGQ